MLKKITVILSLSLLVLFSGLATVNADKPDTSIVWTTGVYDPDAPWESVFTIGETVYIFYNVHPDKPVNIYIENEAGVRLYTVVLGTSAGEAEWVVPAELADDVPIQLFVAAYDQQGDELGKRAFSTCTITITVVPESALGTIALVGATFAGFGLVKYRKSKVNQSF